MKIKTFLCVFLFSAVSQAGAAKISFGEAEKMMLSTNPEAASSSFELEKAKREVSAAKGGFYPSFSASASYYRYGSEGIPAADSYSYGFSASQPLFAPELAAALSSAEESVKISQASCDKVFSSLRYRLREVFSGLINANKTIKLSIETIERRKENLELIRLKYQAGRESKSALMETETALKTAQWENENYKKNLRMLQRKFNRLLGRSPLGEVPETVLDETPEPPAEFNLFRSKLENHYSLRSARALLERFKTQESAASWAFYPTASASAYYRWSGADWPSPPNSWSLGAALDFPIFSGGKISSNLKAASAAVSSAKSALKDASDEVYINAEDAFLNWRQAWAYLDVVKSSLEASKLRAWLIRKQYLAGQTSYFEWRNVEDQLVNDENRLLQAQNSLALSYAAFVAALGD